MTGIGTVLSAINWTPIVGTLVSLLGALLAWVLSRLQGSLAANSAQAKLGALVASLLNSAWASLAPDLQSLVAGGAVSADAQARIRADLQAFVVKATSSDTLTQIAADLNVPLGGLIASIVSQILAAILNAHDKTVTTSSPLQFPVGAAPDKASTLGSAGG
jgi:hypothetical protein